MSNETKNKTAAETVAENVQAIAQAVADNAASVEDVSAASATIAAAPAKPAKTATKAKAEPKPKADTGALRAVGLEACRRHNLARVWVTSDGQAFAQEGDAKEHARNLPGKETIKVTAE